MKISSIKKVSFLKNTLGMVEYWKNYDLKSEINIKWNKIIFLNNIKHLFIIFSPINQKEIVLWERFAWRNRKICADD